jgi:hypothetical protein
VEAAGSRVPRSPRERAHGVAIIGAIQRGPIDEDVLIGCIARSRQARVSLVSVTPGRILSSGSKKARRGHRPSTAYVGFHHFPSSQRSRSTFDVSTASAPPAVARRSAAGPLSSAVFASSCLAGAMHYWIEGAATPVPRRYGHTRRSIRPGWLRRHRARAHRLEVPCSTRTRWTPTRPVLGSCSTPAPRLAHGLRYALRRQREMPSLDFVPGRPFRWRNRREYSRRSASTASSKAGIEADPPASDSRCSKSHATQESSTNRPVGRVPATLQERGFARPRKELPTLVTRPQRPTAHGRGLTVVYRGESYSARC